MQKIDILRYIITQERLLKIIEEEVDGEIIRLSKKPSFSKNELEKAKEVIIRFAKKTLTKEIIEINTTVLQIVLRNILRQKSQFWIEPWMLVLQMNVDGTYYNEYQGVIDNEFMKDNSELFNIIIYDGSL